MKRTPLKRTPFRRKYHPLKRTKVGRNAVQAYYHDNRPFCEVNGCRSIAMPTPHHIDRNHYNDDKDNFFSLCWTHHISDKGVHVVGDIRFCEENNLTNHPKWMGRYNMLIEKRDLFKKVLSEIRQRMEAK